MSWTVIKDKSITTVDADGDTNYLFTKNATITITKDDYTGISSSLKKNTLILNNDITVKDSTTGYVYGVDGSCSYQSKPPADCSLTIRSADNASKLTVEEKMASSSITYAAGIIFSHFYNSNYYGTLYIGATGESFKKTISVTASNNDSDAGAYGIYSYSNVTVNAKLAAPVKVTANAKNEDAFSGAFYVSGLLLFNADIVADLSAASNGYWATVGAIGGDKNLTINGNIAGKISATATASGSYASAWALLSAKGAITISGRITKAMSAKATSKSNSAYAYGIYAKTDIKLKNGIDADITATANGKTATGEKKNSAEAYALRGDTSITITGDIAGKITANATSNDSTASACALYSESGAITISGKITKAMSAKTTSKSSKAYAYVMFANTKLTLNNGIDADITATANGKTLVDVYALRGDTSITISGDIAGKISATATGSKDKAGASALCSGNGAITISGRITKTMSAKATSKSANAEAYGIYAKIDLTINNGIAADLTAVANGKTTASAYALYGKSSITINGDIAGKISATATGNTDAANAYGIYSGDKDNNINGNIVIDGVLTKAVTIKATSKTSKANAYGIYTDFGNITLGGTAADITVMATSGSDGIANAGGIYATGSLTIHGDIAGKLTVKGSAGEGEVSGIYANSLTLRSNLGTISVTGDGNAYGWSIQGVLTVTSGFLTGKATIIGAAKATGLSVGKILDKSDKANVVATLDITVKASQNAIGIKLTDGTDFTLKDSKITVKGGSAIFANDSTKSQNITLESSTLTGAVSLTSGTSKLELTSKSKVIGDVNMGGDMDIVKIHSSSQVKGAITGAETLWLVLDDASAKSTALWEGDIDQSAFGNTLQLDISNATIGVGEYTLMKDTDGSNSWSGTKFKMRFDGSDTSDTLDYGAAKSFADSPYTYELKTDKSGKSLILAVTEM